MLGQRLPTENFRSVDRVQGLPDSDLLECLRDVLVARQRIIGVFTGRRGCPTELLECLWESGRAEVARQIIVGAFTGHRGCPTELLECLWEGG